MNKVIGADVLDGLMAVSATLILELESNKRMLLQSSRNSRRFIVDSVAQFGRPYRASSGFYNIAVFVAAVIELPGHA
jgi:hypothetical protein